MTQRTRRRITVTVDPAILGEVDSYIQEHDGTDRSHIVDEALRCWYARTLHEALVKQHSAPKSPEELEQRLAWKRIRAEQSRRLLHKRQLPDGG